MTLKEWSALHPDDLIEEEPDKGAIAELVKVADREIKDAASVVSFEGKLGHSHNAVLAIAAAALASNGFRIRKGSSSHHWRLIESLEFTLGIEAPDIKELQDYLRKRRLSIYEQSGIITEVEAEGALTAAKRLRVCFGTQFEIECNE